MISDAIHEGVESIEDGNVPTNEFLYMLVRQNKLFISGHFGLNKMHSARDWINLERLFALEQDDFIDPVTDVIHRVILKPNNISNTAEKLALIGFDYYGAILASVIGYKYYIPFTYCFREQSIVDEIEKEMQHINADRIVIITDVIVYGTTICKFIDDLCNSRNIDQNTTIDIVTLFERKISADYFSKIYFQPWVKKIYILNNNFDIEICKKDKSKCLFTDDVCKYRNC